jgi:hypothetical protein
MGVEEVKNTYDTASKKQQSPVDSKNKEGITLNPS